MGCEIWNKSNLPELLQEFPIFYGVNQSDLRKLINAAVVVHYAKRKVIVQEGKNPEAFYLILKGMVKISKISPVGKEFIIYVRHKGEIIAPGLTICRAPYFASSVALEDVDILVFSIDDFLDFMSLNPIVRLRFDSLDIDIIRDMYEKLIYLATNDVYHRLTNVLYSLSSKCGNILSLTHQEIAELTWATLETTTRALIKLRNDDIITLVRGKIIIKNPGKLRLCSENSSGHFLPNDSICPSNLNRYLNTPTDLKELGCDSNIRQKV